MTVQPVEVRGRGFRFLESAFSATARAGSNALLVPEHLVFTLRRGDVALYALKNRLPTIASFHQFAEGAGLMTYGPHAPDLYRRAATFVAKILKGTKPADLPVEEPVRYELVVNLTTAKALGLRLPPSVLVRADRIID